MDRRQEDANCLAARILRSIDRDRRTGEEQRCGLERRRFEKIIRRMRGLKRELGALSTDPPYQRRSNLPQ